MKSSEKHKIISLLAFHFSLLCKNHGIKKTDKECWDRAEEMFNIDIKINGEEHLLNWLNLEENQNV